MPKTAGATVVRSRDGRFFEIPDETLSQYQVQPHSIPAEQRQGIPAGRPAEATADALSLARGLVHIIINAPAESAPAINAARVGDSGNQWTYEPPEVGAPMEWGDDIDPTGGMSSASRRG